MLAHGETQFFVSFGRVFQNACWTVFATVDVIKSAASPALAEGVGKLSLMSVEHRQVEELELSIGQWRTGYFENSHR